MTHLTGMWCLTRPKSKTSRVVLISPLLTQVIKRYLEVTEGQPNPYWLIFHTPEHNPIGPVDDGQGFRDLVKSVGIENSRERFGNETRPGTVSQLSLMGVDPEIIQQILGHSSIAMVEHYRCINTKELMHAMETMENLLTSIGSSGRGSLFPFLPYLAYLAYLINQIQVAAHVDCGYVGLDFGEQWCAAAEYWSALAHRIQ